MKIIPLRTVWVIPGLLTAALLAGCAGTATRKVTTGVSKKIGEKPRLNVGVSRSVERKAEKKESAAPVDEIRSEDDKQ